MAPSRALRHAALALRASRLRTIAFPRHFVIARSVNSPILTSPTIYAHFSRLAPIARRLLSTEAATSAPEPPDYLSESELHIFEKIKKEFEPVKLEVQDISGGCGSMYAIEIESKRFQGLTMIKQHKLVNQVLAEEIKSWHGVQLRTRAA